MKKQISIILMLFLMIMSIVTAIPKYESQKWQEDLIEERGVGLTTDESKYMIGAMIHSENNKNDFVVIEERILRIRERHTFMMQDMIELHFYQEGNETRFTGYDTEHFLSIFKVQRKHEYRMIESNDLYNIHRISKWNDFMYHQRNWEVEE